MHQVLKSVLRLPQYRVPRELPACISVHSILQLEHVAAELSVNQRKTALIFLSKRGPREPLALCFWS